MCSMLLRPISAVLLFGVCVAAQTPATKPSAANAKKNPLLRLTEPWAEADALKTRHMEADARPLFSATAPLEFTLTADFGLINKDHNPESTKRYPGVLTALAPDGELKTVEVQLSARGHFRRMARNCPMVPLRVDFTKRGVAGTVFEGQTTLKLGTGCADSNEYEQITYREYLAYPLFNLVTPLSFRARLARGTYVEAKTLKKVTTRAALFLEHDNDVARRAEGRSVELPRMLFKDLDPETLTRVMLYEYAIGNTDFSIYALHNVRVVQRPGLRPLFLVPYDFDLSGLVHAPYATPDRRLGLASVVERLYRGPCRTVDEFEAAAVDFRAKRADMFALLDSLTDLDRRNREDMKAYLESFFRAIDTRETIRKQFVNGCKPLPTM
jgi:hypothetical protein